LSLSAWRAWIEIIPVVFGSGTFDSRSPLGERGLKSFVQAVNAPESTSRSPLGERGLKYPRVSRI